MSSYAEDSKKLLTTTQNFTSIQTIEKFFVEPVERVRKATKSEHQLIKINDSLFVGSDHDVIRLLYIKS